MATSKIPTQLCFRKCPKITHGGAVVACFLRRKEGQVAPLVHGHVQEDEEDEDEADEDQLMEDIYNGVLAIANIFARVMASHISKDKDA